MTYRTENCQIVHHDTQETQCASKQGNVRSDIV